MILSWISAVMNWLQVSTAVWIAKIKYTILRVVFIISVIAVLLWISIFLYGSFYYFYMPSISVIKPVHFQFSSSPCEESMCSYPEANISLISIDKKQLMMVGQPYIIALRLDMPESPVNQNLGMVMVLLQFYSQKGEPLKESKRTVLLRYKSQLLEILETLAYFPMYMTGAREQKQILRVEFFDQYAEDAYKPASKVHVEVQSKKIQIYSANLHFHAYFTGLRFLLYNWPVLSAICGIGSNLLFLGSIILLSWYRYVWFEDCDKPVVVHVKSKNGRSLEERRKSLRAVLNKERTEVTTIPASVDTQSTLDSVSQQWNDLNVDEMSGATDLDDESLVLISAKNNEQIMCEKKMCETIGHEVTLLGSDISDMELRHRCETKDVLDGL